MDSIIVVAQPYIDMATSFFADATQIELGLAYAASAIGAYVIMTKYFRYLLVASTIAGIATIAGIVNNETLMEHLPLSLACGAMSLYLLFPS